MNSPHDDANNGIQDEVSLNREEEEESFVQQGPHLLTGQGPPSAYPRSLAAAGISTSGNTNASNTELAVHPSDSKDDAPIPSAQIAAVYEELDEGLKVDENEAKLPEYMDDNEAPMPNQYDNGREGKKILAAENKLEIIDDGDAPLIAGQVADIVQNDEEDDILRKKAVMIPALQANSPSTQPEHEVVQPDSNASAPQSDGSGTVGTNAGQSPVVMTRRPPRSMLPRPSTDRDTYEDTPIPLLYPVEATIVREQPVCDATWVSIHDMPIPWWKRYRGCLFTGVGLLVSLVAVVVGVSTRSNDNISNANEASESATIQPSESAVSSMIPSSYPSLKPSQSSMPTPIASPPHHLKIASWNLRAPFPPDIERNLSWSERRDSIASAITYYRPHLLAVQEDCYFMSHDLMHAKTSTLSKGEQMLSDIYKRYGLFNRNGESYPTTNWPTNAFSSIVGRDGEHNSIWYNKHKFHAVQNVTFWLSRTPNVPGSSFDEVAGRIVNCVLLQDKSLFNVNDRDGAIKNSSSQCADVFYCSTHLPSGNVTRQLWSVDVLSQMFAQYHDTFTTKGYSSNENNNQLLMMVAGDFNSAPNSETYNAMIESGFVDARQLSQEQIPIEQYTFTTNAWYDAEDSMIDHVWIYLGTREGYTQAAKECSFSQACDNTLL